ncbi:uncharacterized protein ZBIST_4251 [Zygosaccharomyces bailii]|nr:uncharacterized protein ZBIST_4251 [Zygosaccharomyces bailii]
MSVLLETTAGDIIVDLNYKRYAIESYNFLKLCKCQFYQNQCFFNLHNHQSIQFGDALFGYEDRKELRLHSTTIDGVTGTEHGVVKARLAKATEWPESLPVIPKGAFGNLIVGKAGFTEPLIGSQMLITLVESNTNTSNAVYFGKVIKSCWSTLDKLNNFPVDSKMRPLEDVRIRGAYVLYDPFDDKNDLHEYRVTLPVTDVRLPQSLIDGIQLKKKDIEEDIRRKELSLEIIGDIPSIGIKPSTKVLFICKLNPLTCAKDIATIFQRFGQVISVEIVRDKYTGRSLGYGFIEFVDKRACEQAYKKMEGIIIDDRRIHVDFSQSVITSAKPLEKKKK